MLNALSVLHVVLLLAPLAAQQVTYKLHGIDFGPYKSGQDPNQNLPISRQQIDERMAVIAPYTNWIRTFGCTNGLDQAGAVARERHLKAAIGAWIGRDLAANDREITCVVAVAKAGLADLVIVGSEVMLRGDVSEQQLRTYMQTVRQQIPSAIPITTADTYGMLLDHPNLIQASDVVMGNFFPYWEGSALETAISSLHLAYGRLKTASGNKQVIVSETGWPSGGDTYGAAVPSSTNAASYFVNFISWARAMGVPYFYFEGFDEAWKAQHEGPQGAAWGLWDQFAVLKPGMQQVFEGKTVPDNWSGGEVIGGPGAASIALTFVGPYGDGRHIYGRVLHVKPADYKAAIYILVQGRWWTKPYFNQPLTGIQNDGTFSSPINTGGIDYLATAVRAYLVPNSFSPPLASGWGSLPAELDAFPIAEVLRGSYSICGNVKENGIGVPGVTLALTGGAVLFAQTVATGDYCFPNLSPALSYVVTPNKANTALTPSARTFSNLNGAATGDFVANALPGVPAIPAPSTGASAIATNVTLGWTVSGPVTENDVRFGVVNPPPLAATARGNTYNPGPLNPSTTYYWQIVSKNASGSTASPLWTFTTAPSPCSYALDRQDVILGPGAVLGSINVTAASGCSWSAASNASWITITSGTTGNGNGAVSYSASANQGAVRSSTMTIGGKTFIVSQVSSGLRFVPLVPCRVVDTRLANGQFGGPRLEAGATRSFPLASGACGIPSKAAAYSINVTVVPAASLGFLTIWPSGTPKPLTSLVNSIDGRVKANSTLVAAGTNGAVSIFVTDAANVVLDINGYFVAPPDAGLSFYSVEPCRLADTRRTAMLAAGETRRFPVASHCQIPVTAQAYTLNLTVVPAEPLGFLTLWPAGQAKPFVSTLNAPTGTVTANGATVAAGAGGSVDIFVTNATHVIVDISGYFGPPGSTGESLFYAAPSCRVSDTRNAADLLGGPRLSSSQTRDIPVANGPCALPTAARSYALNATVVPAGPLGFLSLWPSGQPWREVSTLNAFDGAIVSNSAIVPSGTGGAIAALATNPAELILDATGYFAP